MGGGAFDATEFDGSKFMEAAQTLRTLIAMLARRTPMMISCVFFYLKLYQIINCLL